MKPSLFAKAGAAVKARWKVYKDGAPERQKRREEKRKQAQEARDLKRREVEAERAALEAKRRRLAEHDYERGGGRIWRLGCGYGGFWTMVLAL